MYAPRTVRYHHVVCMNTTKQARRYSWAETFFVRDRLSRNVCNGSCTNSRCTAEVPILICCILRTTTIVMITMMYYYKVYSVQYKRSLIKMHFREVEQDFRKGYFFQFLVSKWYKTHLDRANKLYNCFIVPSTWDLLAL